MRLRLTALTIVVICLFIGAWAWPAEEKAEHEYVGATKCKVCHKPQFESWSETKHAKAFSVLSDEEKQKPECVTCHITGTMADGTAIENIECEACHGPGSEYKSLKIMNKKKWAAEPEKHEQMAIEAGLIYPSSDNCTRCHRKEGNPNFKPFDFQERAPKVHEMSEKALARIKAEKTETEESADTTGGK